MVYTRSMVVSRTTKKPTVEGIPAFLSFLTKLLGPEGWLLVLSPGCLKAFAAAFLNPVSSGIPERQPGRGSAGPPSPLALPQVPGQHSKQPEVSTWCSNC